MISHFCYNKIFIFICNLNNRTYLKEVFLVSLILQIEFQGMKKKKSIGINFMK